MTDPRIDAAVDAVIKEKPLYYNEEGKDRLTKALLDSFPKLALDGITSNPTYIGYSFDIYYYYE